MTGIFEGKPFVTPGMVANNVRYHEIVWHAAKEIGCKKCSRIPRKRCSISTRTPRA
jgi:hypothetical protein